MLQAMTRIVAAILAIGVAAQAPIVVAAEWSNLKGQFIFDGKAPNAVRLNVAAQPQCAKHNVVDERLIVDKVSLGIKNVVIFVSSKNVKIHPDYKKTAKDKVTLDNKNCRFDPHIAVVRVSQTLELHNSDPFPHNCNMTPLGDVPANPLLGPNGSVKYNFQKSQRIPVPVTCNIHGWMKGFIVVRDDPYTAVSDDQGRFELKNLPAEELEFTVWHENSGWLEARPDWKKGKFTLQIKPEGNDLGAIKVPAKLFR